MNQLIENNVITEMECGSNFAYLLNDSGVFSPTEYKVLQSQASGCFVRCMRMTYNGRLQLFYLTKDLRTFAQLLPSIDADSFLDVAANLIENVLQVRRNGFLSCQNIDLSGERIFVEPSTHKVSLVYIPLSRRLYEDLPAFENELRTGLVKIISDYPNLSSPKTLQFAVDLSNGALSVEDLRYCVKRGKTIEPAHATAKVVKREQPPTEHLRIVAMNAPTRVEIEVTKDSFVIGKKPEIADGVVSFNKMISRSHCRIDRDGNRYTVTDLHSANGTYVNKKRLIPDQPFPIRNGDIIRMANSDFQVNMT